MNPSTLSLQKSPLPLIRYAGGERGVWRVVRVPDAAWEDLRQLHREREDLLTERTRRRNRLSSKLVAQGIRFRSVRTFWRAWRR